MVPPEGLVALAADPADADPVLKYRDDPAGFFRDVLHIRYVWDKQISAVRGLLRPPYRVMCPAANEVGKTFLAAATVLWWFRTRSPAVVVTTAPTADQLKDVLWKEMRRLARHAGLQLPFLPKACRIERASDDFAVGMTAVSDTSFQGKHDQNMLFVIEEALGVAAEFYEAIETMFKGKSHACLAIFNPTDTATHIYQEYQRASRATAAGERTGWMIERMSAIDHPNIAAELRGEDPPIPMAITLDSFERRLGTWCLPVIGEPKATDLLWPPAWATDHCRRTGQQPRWYRPGPVAEARLLGRFPSQAAYSVWSDGDWLAATERGAAFPQAQLPVPLNTLPEIGVDVAHFGDDNTAFHVRCGGVSLHHEWFNGQDGTVTFARVKQLCKEYAAWANDRRPKPVTEKDIPVKIDDDGIGCIVTDFLRKEGYAVAGIKAGHLPYQTEDYYRRRDELWFTTAETARRGELDLSRLPPDTLQRLREQAMAPTYTLNANGQRIVEQKKETKKRTSGGQSPDDMDALNLAYAHADSTEMSDEPTVGMIRGGGPNPIQEAIRRARGGR